MIDADNVVSASINAFNSDTIEKITFPSTLEEIGIKLLLILKNLKTVIFNLKSARYN